MSSEGPGSEERTQESGDLETGGSRGIPSRVVRQHRFSVWDGSQDPLGDDADALFDRLSEDVFHGWDFETALRRLLSQGWRDRDGRKFAGTRGVDGATAQAAPAATRALQP